MEEEISARLAESVLEAADSMQRLQEELDRISLGGHRSTSAASTPGQRAKRSTSRKTHKKTKKGKRSATSPAPLHDSGARRAAMAESYDTMSLSSEDVSDRPSSPSSSSRFDSAFGSLHSQTDNDSLSSQLSFPQSHPPPPGRGATPATSIPPLAHSTGATSYIDHGPVPRSSYSGSRTVVEATVEQYLSPQLEIPALITTDKPLHPTQAQSSPTVAPGPLHTEDPHAVTVLGTTVQLRQREHKPKVHRQLTSEDMRKHLEWLQASQSGPLESATTAPGEEACVVSEVDEGELLSEGSSSTIVGETESGSQAAALEVSRVREDDGHSKKYGSSWVKVKPTVQHHTKRTKHSPSPQPKGTRSTKGSVLKTHFYQDNLTPQSSPQVPRRYQPTPRTNSPRPYRTSPARSTSPLQDEEERRQPPKRSASILQRLRRRHGSFRRYGRPRRRTPVRRSFSDRFVYHLKRRWVDHEEDLYPVSNPSLLRPIGRLLRTHAGRLHIIELHKPPNGHFGIYITQGAEQKIFISRFANVTAEKLYTGLLTPGDEIVSINGQEIRDKSLDYVYGILSQLNSVVLSLVPVSAHRNW